ncbi:hypothetical protein EEB14_54915 [Rhodococcus sp. WS4]|nr:hypothetical protein EEB14_54915 [Rhodococcus sp. WS4]
MPEKKHNPQPQPGPLGTGARVLVRRPSEEAQTGRIIEDYAELSDTDDLTADPSTLGPPG